MQPTVTLSPVQLQDGTNMLACVTPYHPAFPVRARALGGRWDGRAWRFDPRDVDTVRQICREIYGVDPLADPAAPLDVITVRVRLGVTGYTADDTYAPMLGVGSQLFLLGRELASRSGRDTAVRLGTGVILVSGGFPRSGGSAKRPDLCPEEGTVLEVRDVPSALIAQLDPRQRVHIDVVMTDPAAARDALDLAAEIAAKRAPARLPSVDDTPIEIARRALAALTPEERVRLLTEALDT